MRKSGFVEGTLIATIAIVLTKILGIIYVIPFYAIVGTMGSALYAYAYNIYIMFLDLSTAGIPNAISKIVNEFNTLKKEEAKVRTIKLGVKLISLLSLLCFIILFIFAKPIAMLIIGDLTGGNTIADVTFVIRCVSFSILVVPLLSILRGYLQGHKIIGVSSISQVVEQVLRVATILLGSFLLIKVFKLPIKYGVGLATFSSCVGGLASLIYVAVKCLKNKEELSLAKKLKENKEVKDKDIIKKIIKYAIPMILVSISVAIYDFVDMVLILRMTNHFGYSAATVEFVSTAISTWSKKILMIVTALGTGLTTSLIPSIVEAYTLKDKKLLNNHFNKALQIVLTVCSPMVLGISMLAMPIWTIFYGYNSVGGHILTFNIFTAIFLNLFMVTNFTLQSMNAFKVVYKSAISGYVTNLVLDIVFMYILHWLGMPVYYGAILASICGYIVSITIATKYLKKNYNFKYQETIRIFKKTIPSLIGLTLITFGLNNLIPLNETSRMLMIIKVAVISIIVGALYIFTIYKMKIIDQVFGKEMLNKLKNKFRKKSA
ncbi:MAG: polysaccharide biosynthesis protein [Bacilli bacterium]|nr:polysaccharide biosynthesis protein [Bacilli bacterium]